ncbi:MAG: hypothetical protein JXA18_13495, partial [Chitinispirillaceae bacterium]|nr:hypothetical protein [Chitinispirillaceae bacterium]
MVANPGVEKKMVAVEVLNEDDPPAGHKKPLPLGERLMRKKAVLSENARIVLEKRYLRRDESGVVTETPEELFYRVAENIASAEPLFNRETNPDQWTEKFYNMM